MIQSLLGRLAKDRSGDFRVLFGLTPVFVSVRLRGLVTRDGAGHAVRRLGFEGPRLMAPVVRGSRGFVTARRGVVAVETALLGIPFFFLILGVVVVGFISFCHSTLDYATQKASRQIMIGKMQSQNVNVTQFITQALCPYLPSPLFNCSKIVVNLKIVPESWEPTNWYAYTSANSAYVTVPPLSNSQNAFCLGSGNSYQLLEVLYPLPIYLSFFSSAPNVVQNQYVIMSTAAFKNEPFQGGAATSSGC